MAQESLANIAKHAQAKHVNVLLYQADNTVVLSIKDDGIGFNPDEATDGFGRRSMLERISQLGGTLKISSEVGQGTHVEGHLPFERNLA